MKKQPWMKLKATVLANSRLGTITLIAMNDDDTIKYIDVKLNTEAHARPYAPAAVQQYTAPDFSTKNTEA